MLMLVYSCLRSQHTHIHTYKGVDVYVLCVYVCMC